MKKESAGLALVTAAEVYMLGSRRTAHACLGSVHRGVVNHRMIVELQKVFFLNQRSRIKQNNVMKTY